MEDMKKTIAELERDFDKIASKGVWNDQELSRMKELQKIMYYMEVRCAMKEGNDYPGSEYMPDSFGVMYGARGRSSMGGHRYGDSWPMHHPEYDDMNVYSKKYYDSEREKSVHKLHHMMENTDNAEQKNALRFAINALEQR